MKWRINECFIIFCIIFLYNWREFIKEILFFFIKSICRINRMVNVIKVFYCIKIVVNFIN